MQCRRLTAGAKPRAESHVLPLKLFSAAIWKEPSFPSTSRIVHPGGDVAKWSHVCGIAAIAAFQRTEKDCGRPSTAANTSNLSEMSLEIKLW